MGVSVGIWTFRDFMHSAPEFARVLGVSVGHDPPGRYLVGRRALSPSALISPPRRGERAEVWEWHPERADQGRQVTEIPPRLPLVGSPVQAAVEDLGGATDRSAELPLGHSAGRQDGPEAGRVLASQAGRYERRFARRPLPEYPRRVRQADEPPEVLEVGGDLGVVQPATLAVPGEESQGDGEPG